MPAVRSGPLVGLLIQVILFVFLASTVGLGLSGWAVGIAYAAALAGALTWGMHRSGATALRPADRVTLARAILVGGVTALVADSLAQRPTPVAVFVAMAAVALALDAVDGYVARRTGTTSDLGARFDMEVDAFLIFVLTVYAVRPIGAWVLAIGGMRYAFVVAGWVQPWMRERLPARQWRKVVAATQGIVLTVAVADVLPHALSVVAVAAALAMLVESFGRDVTWLWRHHGPGAGIVWTDERSERRSTR
jgi:phosphatidylglycerophosphate synthase